MDKCRHQLNNKCIDLTKNNFFGININNNFLIFYHLFINNEQLKYLIFLK